MQDILIQGSSEKRTYTKEFKCMCRCVWLSDQYKYDMGDNHIYDVCPNCGLIAINDNIKTNTYDTKKGIDMSLLGKDIITIESN